MTGPCNGLFYFMADNLLQKIFEPSARGKIWRLFALIIIVVFFASMIDIGYYNKGVDWVANKTGQNIRLPRAPEDFHLGLDLLGGTHLVYTADMTQIESGDRTSALEGVRDVIERRVNIYGVSEPLMKYRVQLKQQFWISHPFHRSQCHPYTRPCPHMYP